MFVRTWLTEMKEGRILTNAATILQEILRAELRLPKRRFNSLPEIVFTHVDDGEFAFRIFNGIARMCGVDGDV